jgi:hypothetical protein
MLVRQRAIQLHQSDEKIRAEQAAREEAERKEAEEMAAEEDRLADQEESAMMENLDKINQITEGVLMNAHMLSSSANDNTSEAIEIKAREEVPTSAAAAAPPAVQVINTVII